jgi:CheY-like chemotaxis protein
MGRVCSPAVLVVDDDEIVRRVLVQLVASQGYEVFEASDGQEAWQKLLQRSADVVVSDLQMPECDGRELCRLIRSHPSMRHIRVLIVTGNPRDAFGVRCDAILSKPVSVPRFFEELERMSTPLPVPSLLPVL